MSKKKHRGLRDLDALVVLRPSNFTPKKRDKYVDEKIKMLTKDFYIQLSAEDKAYLYNLNTERAIDKAVSRIIKNRL